MPDEITSMKPVNKRVILYLVFITLASVLLRLALLNYNLTQGSIGTFEYDLLARNLVAGNGYTIEYLGATYKSFAAPLQAFIIAFVYFIFGINVIPVMCLQITLSAAACFVIYFIARRVSTNLISCIAFTLCIFHPAHILYSVKKIHVLSLDTLLFSLIVLFVIRLKERFSLYRSICVGLIFGLAAFSRPTVLAFLPPALLWIYFTTVGEPRKKLIKIGTIVAVLAISCLPWAVRNYFVHNELIVFSSQDTEVFWRSNNPLATGTSYRENGIPVVSSDPELSEKIFSLNELEKRNFFKEEAIKFVKENPRKCISLYATKLKNFWWFSSTSGLLYPREYFVAYRLYYGVILFLALVGIFRGLIHEKGHARGCMLLVLLYMLSICLFQSFFYVECRHRWGIEPFLLIFTAYGLVYLVNVLKKQLKP